MIVYKTINKLNGKIYVGQDRKNDPKYLGSGKLLKRAIKKYGLENFEKVIIETCQTREELNQREIYWIATLKSCDRGVGYNLAPGGTGGDLFTNHPDKEAWRIKNSLAMKGKTNKRSEETKRKLSVSGKASWEANPNQGSVGKKVPEERKDRMRASKTGIIPSKKQCSNCGRFVDPGNYSRFHGNKCKNIQCIFCHEFASPSIYIRIHGKNCELNKAETTEEAIDP